MVSYIKERWDATISVMCRRERQKGLGMGGGGVGGERQREEYQNSGY